MREAAIPGFPGYRVREDGTVWSSWKRAGVPGVKDGGTRSLLGGEWKQLRTGFPSDAYPTVSLVCNKRHARRQVHHLVMLAFVGPMPRGMVTRHLDGNSDHPALSNLAYGTYEENEADKVGHGTAMLGERHHHAGTTERQVREMRRMVRDGSTVASVSRGLGLSYSMVHQAVRGISWAHVPGAIPSIYRRRQGE